jgi:tetratricopeptide (TPR) repeat protein
MAGLAALALCSAAGCNLASRAQNVGGVHHFQRGDYQQAIARFHRANQSDPGNPDGYYNLGAVYHRTAKLYNRPGDLQQAESYYRQTLDRAPNHLEAHRGLAVLLAEQGRRDEGQKLLQDWVDRNPTSAAAKIELARYYDESSEPAAARDMLIEALALEPDNPRALTALGRLREQTGEREQAIANYSRSLALNRNQPEVAQRLASLRSSAVGAPLVTPAGGTRVVGNQESGAAARTATLSNSAAQSSSAPGSSSNGGSSSLNWTPARR